MSVAFFAKLFLLTGLALLVGMIIAAIFTGGGSNRPHPRGRER